MISRAEKTYRLRQALAFDDMLIGLSAAPKIPAGMVRETREVVALARKFNDEVVRPYAGELDLKMHADPDFIPYEFLSKAWVMESPIHTMFIVRVQDLIDKLTVSFMEGTSRLKRQFSPDLTGLPAANTLTALTQTMTAE